LSAADIYGKRWRNVTCPTLRTCSCLER